MGFKVGFKVGDKVGWVSSNSEKRGEVVAVIPAGKYLADLGYPKLGSGFPRPHETYVVKGRQTYMAAGGRVWCKAALYWPRVNHLELLPRNAEVGPAPRGRK